MNGKYEKDLGELQLNLFPQSNVNLFHNKKN